MFSDFLKRLTAPDPAPLPDADARLALVALLVRVARSDGDYEQAERERIDRIVAARYGLSPFEATKLRTEGEALEAEAPDTVRFTRAIKDAVAYDERIGVIEALWQVVLADGVREAEEDALLRLVANLLGINDREFRAGPAEGRRTGGRQGVIASLPMYWRAENAPLWQDFWRHVQSEAPVLPDLTPPEDIPEPWTDHWLRPDLALSMTCGLPFRTVLRDRVAYVATLDFGLGGPAGQYRSVIIARDPIAPGDSPRLAYNAPDSQSGWAVAGEAAALLRLGGFSGHVRTGAHAASLSAVAEGRADIACLDAVTWRILQAVDPMVASVRVVARTSFTPGLPLIAARGADVGPLRAALTRAAERFATERPERMGGRLSVAVLDPLDYRTIPVPAPPPVA